jgi:hypothetical protein
LILKSNDIDKWEIRLKLQSSYYTDWKKPIQPPYESDSYRYEPYKTTYTYLKNPPTSIGGIPIANYLKRDDIDSISKLFVQGKYGFADYDDNLERMLDSSITENPETQKFYFYLLNRVIGLAKSEHYYSQVRYYLRNASDRYFLKNPCGFFEQVKSGPYAYNYFDWQKYLQYGLWEYIRRDGLEYRIKTECPNYSREWKRIEKWMETYYDPDIPPYDGH